VAKKTTPQKQGSIRVGKGVPPDATKFRPGQSGNPSGRPRGESITAALRRLLLAENPDGSTDAEALARKAIAEAKGGNFQFFKEVIDRSDGKVPDRIAGADGQNPRIEIVYVNDWRRRPEDREAEASAEPNPAAGDAPR
jgi:hypothetical protein